MEKKKEVVRGSFGGQRRQEKWLHIDGGRRKWDAQYLINVEDNNVWMLFNGEKNVKQLKGRRTATDSNLFISMALWSEEQKATKNGMKFECHLGATDLVLRYIDLAEKAPR